MIKLHSSTIHQVINISTLLSLSSLLVIGKGHNLAGALLLLPSLFLCFKIKRAQLSKEVYYLILALVIYTLVPVISFIFRGGDTSNMDQPTRFVIIIPILLTLLLYPPKLSFINWGVFFAALFGFIISIIQTQYYDLPRAFTGIREIPWFKGYMPIQDGNFAMTMGLISLSFTIYQLKQKNKRLFFISLLGFIFGISSSILSGSRGGWLILPIAIIYLIYAHRDLLKNKLILASTIIVTLLVCIGISQQEQFQTRTLKVFSEIKQYNENNTNTSSGIRLALWKSALLTAKEHPIFGAGTIGREESRLKQIELKQVPETLNGWITIHAHNQYLEYLSVYGILGVTSLLTVFLYPLFLLCKFKPTMAGQKALKQCAIIHILSTMSYCLTQAFFAHNSGAIFYPLLLTIFLVASGAIKVENQP